MKFKDPKDLKQEINLLDYAIAEMGYKIDKVKSTAKWVRLENESSGDKIIVNTNLNTYFSQGNDNDKGDLIQFKMNRLESFITVDNSNEAFYATLIQLNKFLGSDYDENQRKNLDHKNHFIEKKEKLSKIQDKDWNQTSITDFKFLESRGIDLEILKDPIFKNRLFNTYFKLDNGHLITNTAFGKYIDNELVGLEVRNTKLKSITGDNKGLFITNTEGMKNIDYVFYGESAIDLISYYEILKQNPKFNAEEKNYCFVSFGGNMYEESIDVFLKTLDNLPINERTKFISLTDNDLDKEENKKEGKKYDMLLTASLLNKYSFPLDFKHDQLYFNINFDKNNVSEVELKALVSNQNEKVDQNYNSKDRYGKYLILKENKENNTINLHFPKALSLKDSNFNLFLEITNNKRLYVPHKSKNQDWNDDLKEKKGIYIPVKKNDNNNNVKKNGYRI